MKQSQSERAATGMAHQHERDLCVKCFLMIPMSIAPRLRCGNRALKIIDCCRLYMSWTSARNGRILVAWPKANPGLGKIKSITTLADNVEKAKRDPTFLPTVLTKDFNIPENSNAAWLPYEACVNEKVVPIDYMKKSYAIGGL